MSRPRLIERLEDGLDLQGTPSSQTPFRRKLTLVVAPAGYGKTTLVAAWLRASKYPVAWLSLDENDDNVSVLTRYIVSAVRRQFPGACAQTAELTKQARRVPPEVLIATLINEIMIIPENFVLAIDEYQIVQDEFVSRLIAELVSKQPHNLHLVLITRHDPLLPLPRLRATGQLLEVRAPDLRFQDDEAEAFMRNTVGLAVDRASIIALNRRAEGWVTGLNLAVMSIRGQKDLAALLAKFHETTNVFVNEYLVAEVLDQLPPPVGNFMLQTAILSRLCGPLCEAIADIDDVDFSGRAYLEWVRSANLFVVPIDEQGEWYRYHQLFRHLLMNRLNATCSKAEIDGLHQRASRWFWQAGYVEEALEHALAGHDADFAVALIEEQSRDLLNSQDRSTLQRWLEKLPQETLWQRPVLLLARSWLLFREWRLSALSETLDAISKLISAPSQEEYDRDLAGELASLQAINGYLLKNDYQGTIARAERALELLPRSETGSRALTVTVQALSQQSLGERDTAVQAMETIIRSPVDSGPSKIQAFIGLCVLHLLAGDLRALAGAVDQFLVLAERGGHANAIGAANQFAGWLHYERNDLEAAEKHFVASRTVRFESNHITYVDASLGLARVRIHQGAFDDAQEILDTVYRDTLRLESSDLYEAINALQADLNFRQHNRAQALRWARSVNAFTFHEAVVIAEGPSLAQARILIWGGTRSELKAVQQFLTWKLRQAGAGHYTVRSIQMHIHLAMVHQRLGDAGEAVTSLRKAVLLAQPSGFIRVFADVGQSLRPLLEQLWLSGVAPDYIQQLLQALSAFDPVSSKEPAFDPDRVSLSDREKEVLLLLQQGYKYREISEGLMISLNTVRKHISNIYGKLDVNSRQQAVNEAMKLNLIPNSGSQ